jgi:stage V sporulation protein S
MDRVLKVGASSIPKKVAGSIELVTRAGGPPALLPLGDPAVNQAAKAVAIARASMVDEGVYLYCQPEYRDDKHSSVVLNVLEASRLRKGQGQEYELTAAKSTSITALAGAIAGKVRAPIRSPRGASP